MSATTCGLEYRGLLYVPLQTDKMTVDECWYTLKSVVHSQPFNPPDFKKIKSLSKVWAAQKQLGVSYSENVMQALLPLDKLYARA